MVKKLTCKRCGKKRQHLAVTTHPKTPYTNYDLSKSNIDQKLIDECLSSVELDLKVNKRKKLSSVDKEVSWF